MDEFEKEFPDFDWKNTPAYKHPGGKDCPCPKHEYIREQIKVAKNISANKETNNKHLHQLIRTIILSMCCKNTKPIN